MGGLTAVTHQPLSWVNAVTINVLGYNLTPVVGWVKVELQATCRAGVIARHGSR
jgi:D-mannonate dehydratase